MNKGIGFNNYSSFMRSMIVHAKKKNFSVSSLGVISTGDDVYLFRSPVVECKPLVLVAAGFHGDEPGGVFGVARLIESIPVEVLHSVNLSIIPAVNPDGLKLGTRRDYTHADPNRGYGDRKVVGEVGEILLRNYQTLKLLARDGFLTLHEDSNIEESYFIISNDRTLSAGVTLAALQSAGDRAYARLPDGLHHEHLVIEGYCTKFIEGTFEDMLSRDNIEKSYVFELPETSEPTLRANTARDAIVAFISNL